MQAGEFFVCIGVLCWAAWATGKWIQWRLEADRLDGIVAKYEAELNHANQRANANADAFARAKQGAGQAIKRLTKVADVLDDQLAKFLGDMDRETEELRVAIHQYTNTWADKPAAEKSASIEIDTPAGFEVDEQRSAATGWCHFVRTNDGKRVEVTRKA